MSKGICRVALIGALAAGLVQACAGGSSRSEGAADAAPRPERFTICHGYSCTFTEPAGLKPEEWAVVRRVFEPRPADAAEERRRIARAVALIETAIAVRVGIADDRPGAPQFLFESTRGQMDCIDKSHNASVYLTLIERANLLVWHRQVAIVHRGMLFDLQYPHQSAAVAEKSTGEQFAVDQWFHAPGVVAEIVPMSVWRRGWHPERVRERSEALAIETP